MIHFFKNLFKKKIKIPWWMFINSNPSTMNKKDWNEFTNKVADALVKGKAVIIKIEGKPHIVTKDPGLFGKIHLRKLEPDEYEVSF